MEKKVTKNYYMTSFKKLKFKNMGRIYFKVITTFFVQVGKIKEYFYLFLFAYEYLNCEQYICITFVMWKFH